MPGRADPRQGQLRAETLAAPAEGRPFRLGVCMAIYAVAAAAAVAYAAAVYMLAVYVAAIYGPAV